MQLEDYGFCGIGEAGPFVEAGNIRWPNGSLPVNTHGGNLSEAYIIGMTHVREGVEQIRGTRGEPGRGRRGRDRDRRSRVDPDQLRAVHEGRVKRDERRTNDRPTSRRRSCRPRSSSSSRPTCGRRRSGRPRPSTGSSCPGARTAGRTGSRRRRSATCASTKRSSGCEQSGAGTLYSFTVAWHPLMPDVSDSVPYIPAVVELPGDRRRAHHRQPRRRAAVGGARSG